MKITGSSFISKVYKNTYKTMMAHVTTKALKEMKCNVDDYVIFIPNGNNTFIMRKAKIE